MDILKKELAKQRTLSLYKYQEAEIAELNKYLKEHGLKTLSYADIIRFSIDLALPEIKKSVK